MDFKNLSRWETLAIVFSIAVFVVLSLVVVFRSEWLDSVIYGPEPTAYEADFEPIVDYGEEMPFFEEEPYARVIISSVGQGQGIVSIDLEKAANVTGLELILEKDEGLQFEEDFVCVEPFECLLFDVSENKVSFFAIVPPTLVDVFEPGEIVVGEFVYSGTGRLYLNSESETFVSTMDEPEFNILDLTETEFLLE